MEFNGAVYFVAHDGSSPAVSQIWATASGTTMMAASFAPAYTAGSLPASGTTPTATLGSTLIFVANDGTQGPAVWASDGTALGTVFLAPVDPANFVVFTTAQGDEEVYWVGDSTSGPGFWETDGTLAGTTMLKSLPSPTYSGYGYSWGHYNLTVADGQLFFTSADGNGGQDLWVSDGTAAGTTVVQDFIGTDTYNGSTTYFSLNVSNLTAAAGTLFFTAFDPTGGTDLWTSNGTTAGTTQLDDFKSSSGYGSYYDSSITNLTAAAGKLFFVADPGTSGPQPWASDGTPDGTVLLADVNPGSTGSAPSDFTQLGNDVYFFMNESATTVGLWQSDGTAAGTAMVFDAFPSVQVNAVSYSPTLASLTSIGSKLFFSAEYADDSPQYQLWASDGTNGGTGQVNPSSLPSGSSFGEMQDLIPLGDLLVFTADDGQGAELWESDGTAGGTTLITDQGPSIGNYSYSSYSNAYGDQTLVDDGILYFAGHTPAAGVELWQTDGTAAGTQMVSDFSPGTYSSDPLPLAVVNNQLFFYANDGIHGEELWIDPLASDPSITPIPAQTAVVGQPLAVTVQAAEPGNPSAILAYSLIDGPPEGALINSSGDFSWTPTPAQTPGVYEFTVQVTDTSDTGQPTSSATFEVTLSTAPAAQVAITSAPSTSWSAPWARSPSLSRMPAALPPRRAATRRSRCQPATRRVCST